MARIDHIALWVKDLERMKDFYIKYLGGQPGEKYINPGKHFSSYFIVFKEGARLELMHTTILKEVKNAEEAVFGWAHLAFALGSKGKVLALTELLRKEGYPVKGEPRVTGDGYFESVILDPEGNKIELTI